MFYAVYNVGIFTTWNEVVPLVHGVKGAKFKKFKKKDDAEYFLKHGDTPKMEFSKDQIHVFTDGSCKRVKGTLAAGVGIVFVHTDKAVGDPFMQFPLTNNRAEIKAVTKALQMIDDNETKPIVVHTDSRYVINSITAYIYAWMKNGWKTQAKTDVLNKDLWQELYQEILKKKKTRVLFEHVKGHAGHVYNEIADKMANKGAEFFMHLQINDG